MEQRIKILADKALASPGGLLARDAHIRELIMGVADGEKLPLIRKEYARIIETDECSLLAGQYPSVPFWEREEIDFEAIWRAAGAEHKDLSAYENTLLIDGGNHFCSDYEAVLKYGFLGLLEQIEEKKKTACGDEAAFYEELSYTVRAIEAWVLAYSDAFSAAAEREPSAKRRAAPGTISAHGA